MEPEQGGLVLVGKLLSAAWKDLQEPQGKADPVGFPWTRLSGLGGMTPASPSSAEMTLPVQNELRHGDVVMASTSVMGDMGMRRQKPN